MRLSAAALAGAIVAIAGCASEGATTAATPAAAPAPTEVIFYPKNGQSSEQQDRDRYECYLWAVKRTGYDPSQLNLPPTQQVVVRPEVPPGATVLSGAVVGAAMGAAIGSPNSPGEGALVGAMAGSAIGAVAASSQQASAERLSKSRAAEYQARLDAQAATYRRAMSACLEGRGYAVR